MKVAAKNDPKSGVRERAGSVKKRRLQLRSNFSASNLKFNRTFFRFLNFRVSIRQSFQRGETAAKTTSTPPPLTHPLAHAQAKLAYPISLFLHRSFVHYGRKVCKLFILQNRSFRSSQMCSDEISVPIFSGFGADSNFSRFSGKVERLKMLASNFWAKKLCSVNVSQDGLHCGIIFGCFAVMR